MIAAVTVTSLCMVTYYVNFKQFQYHHYAECANKERTIVIHMIGGLGNHLWLYSSLYGLAKKTNRRPIGCYGYDIRQIFSHLPGSVELRHDSYCNNCTAMLPVSSLRVSEKHHLNYDTALLQNIKVSTGVDTNFLSYGPPGPVAPEIYGFGLSAVGQGTRFYFFQRENHIYS